MKAGLITASVTQLYKTDEFHATALGSFVRGVKTAKLREVSTSRPGPARRLRCRTQAFPPRRGPAPAQDAGCGGAGRGSPRETLRASARWDEQAVSLRSE